MKNAVGVLCGGDYAVEPCIEIGEGGMLFYTKRALKVGQAVVMNFYVPKRDFITVTGELIYKLQDKAETNSKVSFGVKFNNLSFESRRMIRDYIAEKTAHEA
jgi:hypothetical protein